jgi:predicted ATPase
VSLLGRRVSLFHRVAFINYLLLRRCHFLRDNHGMRQQAEALLGLARENGLTAHVGIASFRLGRIMVEEKNFAEGIETMREGRRTSDAIGAGAMRAGFCCVLAEAYLAAGRPSEGLPVVEEAIAHPEQIQDRFCEPELHRLKGELLLLSGAPESDVEKSLREAIAIAQRQEARSWELRAATSLARLLRKQGKIDEARTTLSVIYNWFTEGFDTADLKDAKALLDEIGV